MQCLTMTRILQPSKYKLKNLFYSEDDEFMKIFKLLLTSPSTSYLPRIHIQLNVSNKLELIIIFLQFNLFQVGSCSQLHQCGIPGAEGPV